SSSTNPKNFWRVFASFNDAHSISCTDTVAGSITGEQFRPIIFDTMNPHPQLDSFEWTPNIAYWKIDGSPTFQGMQNQWAIQMRIPVLPNDGTSNMRKGIIEGSSIWFEGTADLNGSRASIANWPRAPELTTHVCQKRAGGVLTSLVHPDLGLSGKWSNL